MIQSTSPYIKAILSTEDRVLAVCRNNGYWVCKNIQLLNNCVPYLRTIKSKTSYYCDEVVRIVVKSDVYLVYTQTQYKQLWSLPRERCFITVYISIISYYQNKSTSYDTIQTNIVFLLYHFTQRYLCCIKQQKNKYQINRTRLKIK